MASGQLHLLQKLRDSNARIILCLCLCMAFLLLPISLSCAYDTKNSVCDEEFVRVANTNFRQGQREGNYRKMADELCRGKPIWKQQRSANSNGANYIFFYKSPTETSRWLIGVIPCSTDGSIAVEGDTRCPCHPSLVGRWREFDGMEWGPRPQLTVQCQTDGRSKDSKDSKASKASKDDGNVDSILTTPIIGSSLGLLTISVNIFIICCCLSGKKTRFSLSNCIDHPTPTNNRATGSDNSTIVRINSISDQTTRSGTNIVSPNSLHQLPPFAQSISSNNNISSSVFCPPPSYSTIGFSSPVTPIPSSVCNEPSLPHPSPPLPPPPSYEEVTRTDCIRKDLSSVSQHP